MNNPMLTKCPVCGAKLTVTRLHCGNCDTTIEGSFNTPLSPFARLNEEQIQFLVNFVRCEGRFNRLEEEMKLSYPTLRNRLNDIIRTLGFEPGKEEAAARSGITDEERRQILEDLNAGTISSAEARRRLLGKKDEEKA